VLVRVRTAEIVAGAGGGPEAEGAAADAEGVAAVAMDGAGMGVVAEGTSLRASWIATIEKHKKAAALVAAFFLCRPKTLTTAGE
jgi:hypothetical protein